MEEDVRNEVVQEQPQGYSGRIAGGLIGLAIGLFVASSMTILTSLWIVWLWAIVPIVLLPIGWWLGRLLPKVSGLSVVLLFVLCFVAYRAPIEYQRLRLTRIVGQLSEFPSAELQEVRMYLFGTDVYPGFHANFTTDAAVRDVVDYYRESLSEKGWSMLEASIDDDRSAAAAQFELPGRYRLLIQMKDDSFTLFLSMINFTYNPPKLDTKRIIESWNYNGRPWRSR